VCDFLSEAHDQNSCICHESFSICFRSRPLLSSWFFFWWLIYADARFRPLARLFNLTIAATFLIFPFYTIMKIGCSEHPFEICPVRTLLPLSLQLPRCMGKSHLMECFLFPDLLINSRPALVTPLSPWSHYFQIQVHIFYSPTSLLFTSKLCEVRAVLRRSRSPTAPFFRLSFASCGFFQLRVLYFT
jgi:hypothetical protein